MNTKTKDIVIIGAGLTGLTLAYYLIRSGKSVLVIEKQEKAGGVINTANEEGFIFETGPNTGVLSTPEIAALFEDLKIRCTLETANPKSKKRYILKNGKWHALPSGLLSAIRTPLFTFKDKCRILYEPWRKPGTNPDESISQLVIRRMGKSYLDYAVDPFISGIYAGDPGKLVTRFALPKLYALEQNYGSFIMGAIKKKTEPKSEAQKKATGEVFSVKGGLGNLIKALTEEIGYGNILTGINKATVLPAKGGFEVSFTNNLGDKEDCLASKVITTIGSYALPELLPFISQKTLNPLTSLEFAGVVQVAVGYKNWKGSPIDAFGGLIPTKEKREVLGILFPSAIFEGRTPVNGALLSVFLGGVKNRGILKKSDEEITAIVLNEIKNTLFESSHPDLLRIYRYTHAIPQYEKSSGERFAAILKIQDQYPGLIIAGNIVNGIGMADRVKQAKRISELITE